MLTLPAGRKLLVLDLVLVLWVLGWIVVGLVVANTVAELNVLTGAVRTVGDSVNRVGQTLGSINVPLLGRPLERAGETFREAAVDIVRRGEGMRATVDQTATLIGTVVAAIPILTLLVPYVPARARRASEAAALRGLLGGARGDRGLEAFLADRALAHVSYRRLQAVTERPWETDDASTRRALAREELRRLGVSPERNLSSGGPSREPPR